MPSQHSPIEEPGRPMGHHSRKAQTSSRAYPHYLSRAACLHSKVGLALHQREDSLVLPLSHYKQAVKFHSLFSSISDESRAPNAEELQQLDVYVDDLERKYESIVQQPVKCNDHDITNPGCFHGGRQNKSLIFFSELLPSPGGDVSECDAGSYLLFIVMFNMAHIYRSLEQPDMAYMLLERAVPHAPNPGFSAKIHNNLACLLSECYDRHDDAASVFANALLLLEDYEDGRISDKVMGLTLLNSSRVHFQLGLLEAAAEQYDLAAHLLKDLHKISQSEHDKQEFPGAAAA